MVESYENIFHIYINGLIDCGTTVHSSLYGDIEDMSIFNSHFAARGARHSKFQKISFSRYQLVAPLYLAKKIGYDVYRADFAPGMQELIKLANFDSCTIFLGKCEEVDTKTNLLRITNYIPIGTGREFEYIMIYTEDPYDGSFHYQLPLYAYEFVDNLNWIRLDYSAHLPFSVDMMETIYDDKGYVPLLNEETYTNICAYSIDFKSKDAEVRKKRIQHQRSRTNIITTLFDVVTRGAIKCPI